MKLIESLPARELNPLYPRGIMNLCKKIDGTFYCIAKNRKQQFLCVSSKLDMYDDCCQYGWYQDVCKIGDLIEIDQQTQDEDAKI